MAEKIAQDQALTAKVLRLANSSFYGMQRRVVSIQQAITILGISSVRTLIIAAAVIDIFATREKAHSISWHSGVTPSAPHYAPRHWPEKRHAIRMKHF